MKKYLSITELLAKRTLWKVLAVIAVMFAAEFFWARSVLINGIRVNDMNANLAGGTYTYPATLWNLGIQFTTCYAVALVLITLIQLRPFMTKDSSAYQVRMLLVSERSWMLTAAVYDTACLFLAWAATSGAILASARVYMGLPQYQESAQRIYVEILQNPRLNLFVPADNKMLLCCMLMITIGIGLLTAAGTAGMLHGKAPVLALVGTVLVAAVLGIPAFERLIKGAAWVIAAAAVISFAGTYVGSAEKGKAEEADDGE